MCGGGGGHPSVVDNTPPGQDITPPGQDITPPDNIVFRAEPMFSVTRGGEYTTTTKMVQLERPRPDVFMNASLGVCSVPVLEKSSRENELARGGVLSRLFKRQLALRIVWVTVSCLPASRCRVIYSRKKNVRRFSTTTVLTIGAYLWCNLIPPGEDSKLAKVIEGGVSRGVSY